jgi:hypothetical protein
MLRTWRAQTVRNWTGKREFPDGPPHTDGWPTVSLLGRIDQTWGGGPPDQRWAEVYTGDGLHVWRALHDMPFQPRLVLYAKYLSSEPVKRQAHLLGISVSLYWSSLDCAYYFLAGRMAGMTTGPSR